jgi:N-acylglucosamine 2-epimerase
MSERGIPAGWTDLAARYGPLGRAELGGGILPFWQRTLDEARGGIFNCWNNAGTRRASRDKFTWSQGRFVWLWSRLAECAARGEVPGDPAEFRAQAGRTVRFLQAHAFLPDGRCAFLLSESGELQEAIPGRGPAPSVYADCFVVMGFAEYARVSGDGAVLEAAWRLFSSIEARVAAGPVPTHPEPTPAGYTSHAIAMITLNLTLVLGDAAAGLRHPLANEIGGRTRAAAQRILDVFLQPDGRIVESRPDEGDLTTTRLARHVNPGHALEGLWMLLTVAEREGRADWRDRAAAATRFALERGWDEEFGGILHYVDCAGGPPRGVTGDSVYEANVVATWDTKLWWVHSEALYTTALGFRLTGDPRLRAWFERLWDYTLRVFPNPDRAVGEWIQIRDRRGAPLERVVALPVKDPYHIARNLIQLTELFAGRGPV